MAEPTPYKGQTTDRNRVGVPNAKAGGVQGLEPTSGESPASKPQVAAGSVTAVMIITATTSGYRSGRIKFRLFRKS